MHAAVLRYFEAVAKDGSIRRASERLCVSASAVNRQILKLELSLIAASERSPTVAARAMAKHLAAALVRFAADFETKAA